MISPIPKWTWKRYAILWKKFKDKPFTYKKIEEVLKYDDKSAISVMLMELRKAGWLNMELSQEDARMRIYKLNPPEQVIEETEYDIKKHKG